MLSFRIRCDLPTTRGCFTHYWKNLKNAAFAALFTSRLTLETGLFPSPRANYAVYCQKSPDAQKAVTTLPLIASVIMVRLSNLGCRTHQLSALPRGPVGRLANFCALIHLPNTLAISDGASRLFRPDPTKTPNAPRNSSSVASHPHSIDAQYGPLSLLEGS